MSETLTKDETRYFESGGTDAPKPDTPIQRQADPEPSQDPDRAPPPDPHTDPAPEPPAADPPADPASDKTVPHQAMHQERERRKAAEKELQAIREQMARLEGAQEAIKQRETQAQAPPPAAKVPAWEEDPKGHLEARLAQLAEAQGHLTQAEQARVQQQRQQQQLNELQQWGTAQENEFSKTHTDYLDAVKHLRDSRAAELRALGANDQQINYQIAVDTLQLAEMARAQGANLADRIYTISKQRGFQGKPASTAEPPEQTIERQNRGKDFSSTGSTGAPPQTKMSADRLSKMSEREFYEFSRKNPEEFERILTG
jgi:hypothetical protein